MRWVPLIAMVILSSCSQNNTKKTSFRFDKVLVIETSITSRGGALGEEVYKINALYNEKKIKFFSGVNPRKFSVKFKNNLVSIVFCDGRIDLAQPIYLPPPENRLIKVEVDLSCIN